MACTNHTWLNGSSERNREHNLWKVAIRRCRGSWCIDEEVKVVLTLKRDDGDYRLLRLTEKDILSMLPHLLEGVSEKKLASAMKKAFAKK